MGAWAIMASALFIVSCKRDLPVQKPADQPADVDAKNLKAPSGFNFETEKTLDVKVKVTEAKTGDKFIIKIYADEPSTGKLISTGITNSSFEYSKQIRVAAAQQFIYIEKINPDGTSKFEKLAASRFVTATMNKQPDNTYVVRKSGSGMDCTTGCTVTYNNPSSNITVNNGEIACITGTISGSINLTVNQGGIAKICATGQFGEVTGNDGGKVYFLESSNITINTQVVMYDGSKFKNWSNDLKGGDFILVTATAENNGDMEGSVYVFTNSEFTNNGVVKMNSTGSFYVYTDCEATNNGRMEGINSTTVSGNSILTNNCYMDMAILGMSGRLINNSYIKADYTDAIPDGGSAPDPYFELNNGAQMTIVDINLYAGEITGTGASRSKLKISGNTNLSTGTEITGTLDLCDANGVEVNNGTIQSPALASCAGYIATSTCNPEGFGSSGNTDTDGDGIADNNDEFPYDINRAFTSYYPNATTTATVAFEDMWPHQADYEFNDLVVAYNVQHVLNADNKVVDMKIKMQVKAVGAHYVNGFGFQLDEVSPSEISNITGQVLSQNIITRNANNTEAGQAKAVIICFDSPEPTLHRAEGSMFNTIKTNFKGTSDSIYLDISFVNPVEDTKIGISKINPFMFINKTRGHEVHLPDFKPTSLADMGLLGGGHDRSNPATGYYYKDMNGLPWAL